MNREEIKEYIMKELEIELSGETSFSFGSLSNELKSITAKLYIEGIPFQTFTLKI